MASSNLKALLIIISLALSTAYTYGQNIGVSIGTSYGSYNMKDFKGFQEDLFADVSSDIDVPFKITDNFPAFFGYELSVNYRDDKWDYGVQAAYRSTGGRISYSDFSGKYNIDNELSTIEFRGSAGYNIYEFKKLEFFLNASSGIAYTRHDLGSVLQLTGQEGLDESFRFSSVNIIIAANAQLLYKVVDPVFLKFSLGYDYHIRGDLVFSENNDAVLTDTQGSEVRANWSGVRVGIGVGLRI